MAVSLVIIAHNIRSTHNVGSLMRTAEGLGVEKLYITGYTPYPKLVSDTRLPHLAEKTHAQICKTALGAEILLPWEHISDVHTVITELRSQGYTIAGLEQTPGSTLLPSFRSPDKLALVLGSEVTGIDTEILGAFDYCLEIPMAGQKESFNVVEAATMVMYQCLSVTIE